MEGFLQGLEAYSKRLTAVAAPYVNLNDPLLFLVLSHVLFNPMAWNAVARLEYRTHFLTRLFCGHNKVACAFNGVIIFLLGLSRDFWYNQMLKSQPTTTIIEDTIAWPHTKLAVDCVAGVLLLIGTVFVLGAYWQLGLIGTYLGDYFGILLPKKVTGFPFNVSSSPMYDGSTLNFLAFALYNRSPAGLIVTVAVYVCYRIACVFEEFVVSILHLVVSCWVHGLFCVCVCGKEQFVHEQDLRERWQEGQEGREQEACRASIAGKGQVQEGQEGRLSARGVLLFTRFAPLAPIAAKKNKSHPRNQSRRIALFFACIERVVVDEGSFESQQTARMTDRRVAYFYDRLRAIAHLAHAPCLR